MVTEITIYKIIIVFILFRSHHYFPYSQQNSGVTCLWLFSVQYFWLWITLYHLWNFSHAVCIITGNCMKPSIIFSDMNIATWLHQHRNTYGRLFKTHMGNEFCFKMSGIAEHLQLVAQTILYYCIVLFGLLISIPVGITTVSVILVYFPFR